MTKIWLPIVVGDPSPNPIVSRVAMAKAQDMADRNYHSHTTPEDDP